MRTCGFYANRVALRGNFHHFRGIDEVIIIPIAALAGSETTEEASAFLNEQVDLFVEKLSAQNPMIGMFVQGPLLEQVKGMLAAQMSERFPQFIERVVERVEHRLDVSEIVRAKIEALPGVSNFPQFSALAGSDHPRSSRLRVQKHRQARFWGTLPPISVHSWSLSAPNLADDSMHPQGEAPFRPPGRYREYENLLDSAFPAAKALQGA